MGSIWLVLALVFSLLIAIVALANQQAVTVNYLFGQAEIYLIILILGSAIAGALTMGLFSLFRGIRAAIKFREERRAKEELQLQIRALEKEKLSLEAELGRARLMSEESPAGETREDSEASNSAGAPLPEESEPEQQDR